MIRASIFELDEVMDEDWIEVGQRVIKSMIHQAGKLAQRELKRKMKTKLLMHGFDGGISSEIIASLDLEDDEDLQMQALKKQGIKAYKRFRRYDESECKFRMKKYLFSHGFSTSEIDAFLNGEVINFDDLAEY